MRVVSVVERRARLVRRHGLTPGSPVPDCLELAERLVGLHASDPATVFLSARARVPGLTPEQLEAALYDEQTLVKHLGMRRTLFVLPTSLLPVVQAACTNAVVATERKRLVRDVEQGGISANGVRWLRRAEAATLEALETLGSATGAELSRAVPEIQPRLVYGEGKSWGGTIGVAGRVLTILAGEGRITRGRPSGTWTSSRHRWQLAGALPAEMDEGEAQAELVRRWLAAFGPATLEDVAWWTGLGVVKVRRALAAIGAAAVELDGKAGVVLPDDLDPVAPPEPTAALLPSLDATTMGWKRRAWYLGAFEPELFDSTGNAGPTVWWDGRVVGAWAQLEDGEIVFRLLENVGSDAAGAIEREAAQLSAWLGETRIKSRFPGPFESGLRTR